MSNEAPPVEEEPKKKVCSAEDNYEIKKKALVSDKGRCFLFAKFAKNNLSGLAEEEKQLYRNVFHSFAAMRIIFGKGKGK